MLINLKISKYNCYGNIIEQKYLDRAATEQDKKPYLDDNGRETELFNYKGK